MPLCSICEAWRPGPVRLRTDPKTPAYDVLSAPRLAGYRRRTVSEDGPDGDRYLELE